MNTSGHLGELTLRRRRAGEPLDGAGAIETVDAHLAACAACKARSRALDDEQRRFEQEISFDRFAAGVERATRSGAPAPRRRVPARVWLFPTMAMAAADQPARREHGDLGQPGLQRVRVAQPADALPGDDHDLLQDIRGLGVLRAQHPGQHPAQVAAVPGQQGIDGARFSGFQRRYQAGVVGLFTRAVRRRRRRYQAQHAIHG